MYWVAVEVLLVDMWNISSKWHKSWNKIYALKLPINDWLQKFHICYVEMKDKISPNGGHRDIISLHVDFMRFTRFWCRSHSGIYPEDFYSRQRDQCQTNARWLFAWLNELRLFINLKHFCEKERNLPKWCHIIVKTFHCWLWHINQILTQNTFSYLSWRFRLSTIFRCWIYAPGLCGQRIRQG